MASEYAEQAMTDSMLLEILRQERTRGGTSVELNAMRRAYTAGVLIGSAEVEMEEDDGAE